jgi:hypothetical protein
MVGFMVARRVEQLRAKMCEFSTKRIRGEEFGERGYVEN